MMTAKPACRNLVATGSSRPGTAMHNKASHFSGHTPLSCQLQCSRACRNRSSQICASASTETQDEEDLQIEGIQRSYCDDFVCTSSPQVEQNAKALARETTRFRTWTSSIFRKDVQYKDPYLSLRGIDNYDRLYFVKECVSDPKVLVTSLRMLDGGKSQVQWRLRGTVGVVPIDADLTSTFTLDLITGRVKEHTESWDLSRCSSAGKLAYSASRLAWSIGVRAKNAKDDSSKFLEQFKQDDSPQITADPTDPTKFFQDDNDPTKDLLSIGAIIAFVYFIFKAYQEIEGLKH